MLDDPHFWDTKQLRWQKPDTAATPSRSTRSHLCQHRRMRWLIDVAVTIAALLVAVAGLAVIALVGWWLWTYVTSG